MMIWTESGNPQWYQTQSTKVSGCSQPTSTNPLVFSMCSCGQSVYVESLAITQHEQSRLLEILGSSKGVRCGRALDNMRRLPHK